METAIGCLLLTVATVLLISVRYWDTKTPPRLDRPEWEEAEPEPAPAQLR